MKLGAIFEHLQAIFNEKTIFAMERDSHIKHDKEVVEPSSRRIPKVHLQDLADKPIKAPTLLTFPLGKQLTGTNFSIWKVIMLAVLESYELAFFIMRLC
ncbi:hypothetical protein GOP47_0002541 [Adiantum capillus-veneris]|uniref:Uncharacterized protein n=1 Tax=Adiantum capillus-veneris TaxID=13818 RepID=A0A9D4VAT2_ADICA|nr:hypothetical protein GOP47_0002541 [Adiantum capillus-veneris]